MKEYVCILLPPAWIPGRSKLQLARLEVKMKHPAEAGGHPAYLVAVENDGILFLN